MKIKPLGERVLIEQIEAETKTASGLIIPDSAQEKPLQAKIVSIGDEVKTVKVGDTVLYAKYSGTELNIDDKKYLMIELSDILATL